MNKSPRIIIFSIFLTTLVFGQNIPKCEDLRVQDLVMENDSIIKITIQNSCTNCSSVGYCDFMIIRKDVDTIANSKCFCLFTPSGAINGTLNPEEYMLPSKVSSIPPITDLKVLLRCALNCDSILFSPTLGVSSQANKKILKIYPNPSDSNVKMNIELAEANDIQIDIMDKTGKKVFSEKYFLAHKEPVILRTESLPAGIYLVNIKVDNMLLKTEKWIKLR